jgi:hypothetical protein
VPLNKHFELDLTKLTPPMKEALLHQQTSDANEVEGRNNHRGDAAGGEQTRNGFYDPQYPSEQKGVMGGDDTVRTRTFYQNNDLFILPKREKRYSKRR